MMVTTSIALCTEPTPDALQSAINTALGRGAKSVLIIAAAGDSWTPQSINPLLSQCKVPIFGAISPSIILKNKLLSHGTIIIGLETALELIVIEELSKNEANLYRQLNRHKAALTSAPTLFSFFDGLTSNLEQFTEGLYNVTGLASGTVGCGAGFLDFIQRPCIFTNSGLIADAAVIAVLASPHYCGISHGWRILDGPYLATQSQGNILKSINYLPAYDSYKKAIESHSGLNLSNDDFFTAAQTYPLGIATIDDDLHIRSPIQSDGDSLICIGDIPENATIYLLNGDAESLVASAKEAALRARTAFTAATLDAPTKKTIAFVIDCISKAIFLGQRFEEELKVINDNLDCCDEILGVLSIGEICNSKNGPIELLNKSTVVAIL